MKKSDAAPKITIRRDLLAAVAKWTSIDDSRPHLCRVLFDKSCYVATDGHRLVYVPLTGVTEPFCIDRVDLLAAVAAARELGSAQIDIATDPDGRVFLSVGFGSVLRVRARDASKYPPYKQVLKTTPNDGKPPNGIILQPRYLAAVSEVLAASNDDGSSSGVEVTGWGPEVNGEQLDAITFKSRSGIVFVIMPMRAQ